MEVWERIGEEFKWSNFLFNYKHPGRFVQTEYGTPRLYVLWRLIWMCYHVSAIASSGYLEQFYASTPENRIKWFIFLTNWTFIILTLATICDFCATVYVQWKHPDWLNREREVEELAWYLKTVWVLCNLANTMSILISACYWAFGPFDPTKGLLGHRVLPFLGHGMNTIYIICNLCVTGMPIRLLHVWVCFVYTVVYGMFNFAYIYMGGTDDSDHHYIYPPIDWRRNPIQAEVLAGLMLMGVLVSHITIFLFHLVRTRIARPGTCSKNREVMEEQVYHPMKEVGQYGSTVRTRAASGE